MQIKSALVMLVAAFIVLGLGWLIESIRQTENEKQASKSGILTKRESVK
jgi:hypothetical protein